MVLFITQKILNIITTNIMAQLFLILLLNFNQGNYLPVEIKIQEVAVIYCDICTISHLGEDAWWNSEEQNWYLIGKFVIFNNTNKKIKIPKDLIMYAVIKDNTGNDVGSRKYPSIFFELTNFRGIVPLPVIIPKSENVLVNFYDSELWSYNLIKGEKYKIQYIFHVGYNRKLKRQLKVDRIYSDIFEFEY